MTDLIGLERGDPEDLAGTVIIIASVNAGGDEESAAPGEGAAGDASAGGMSGGGGQTMALYCTTRASDFAERFGAPEGGLEELARKQADAARQAGATDVLPMYGAPIDPSQVDLAIAEEDVIELGGFSDAKRCRTAIQLAAHVYLLRYSEQLQASSGMREEDEDEVGEQAEGGEDDAAGARYETVERDALSDHLQKHFIGPLMHALEDNDRKTSLDIAHEFIRFCGRRGPLTDDAYAIASVVRAMPDGKCMPLLYKYFDKVLAISDERFEDAAKLRDEIRALKQEMSQGC